MQEPSIPRDQPVIPDQPELLCAYCSKPADGPMLEMLGPHAHVDCVLVELARLLDPEWEKGKPNPVFVYVTGFAGSQGQFLSNIHEE